MTSPGATRDDRVLAYTKVLSLAIAPFLLAAFVVLYLFPGHTRSLFAWTISSSMTARMLASAYLGGAYFFLRLLWGKRWHEVKTGFVAVTVFATLLGVATIMHWAKFNHGHVPFWIWTTLYFAAPFLVLGAWLTNRRFAAPVDPGERRVGRIGRWVVGSVGLLALVQGLIMYLSPATIIPIWPWPLTPLTARVVGAIFCLGSAGLAVFVDARWTALKLMVQVAIVMIVLMVVAAVLAGAELKPDRPLTWLLIAGFVGVLVAAVWWYAVELREEGHLARP
jgi:hypothetical protein